MSRRLLLFTLVLVVVLVLPGSAFAQEYLFGVERESVDVFWNADGTSSLEYTFHFVNQPGAHPIDFALLAPDAAAVARLSRLIHP